MASASISRAVPVEHVVLAGNNVTSSQVFLFLPRPARHAPRARFARWEAIRARQRQLPAIYADAPLLAGRAQ